MKKRTLNFDNFMLEKKQDPIEVTVLGKVYKIKPEIPAIVPITMGRVEEGKELDDAEASRMVVTAADMMFGKEAVTEFAKHMSTDNIALLVRKCFDLIKGESLDEDEPEEISDEDGLTVKEDKAKK